MLAEEGVFEGEIEHGVRARRGARVGGKQRVAALEPAARGDLERVIAVAPRVLKDEEAARLAGNRGALVDVRPSVAPPLVDKLRLEVDRTRQSAFHADAPVDESGFLHVALVD